MHKKKCYLTKHDREMIVVARQGGLSILETAVLLEILKDKCL